MLVVSIALVFVPISHGWRLFGSADFTRRLNCPLLSMSSSATVDVALPDRSYPIYIGTDLLSSSVNNLILNHVKSKKALIVSNTKISPLYSSTVRKALESAQIETFEVVLPDGEEYKNMEVLMKIIDGAMEAKLDRKSTLIALGGGVVGDMTGFAASIYQRGVRFIQIPTTLMAMVDSAVGGKTGVNHPSGKNMIGAFYQPHCVIVDTTTLNSLPDRELRSGLAEVIKYGLIRDRGFFEWLEINMHKLLARDAEALAYAIRVSCENKAAVVAADEREAGVRATLNLGHTFGHAIETGLGYGAWLHGEAVAAGTMMAADMSMRQGWIDEALYQRVDALMRLANLPVNLDNKVAEDEGGAEYKSMRNALHTDAFLDIMSVDKKVSDGKLSLVLLKGELGKCVITEKFDETLLRCVVDDYCSKRK